MHPTQHGRGENCNIDPCAAVDTSLLVVTTDYQRMELTGLSTSVYDGLNAQKCRDGIGSLNALILGPSNYKSVGMGLDL